MSMLAKKGVVLVVVSIVVVLLFSSGLAFGDGPPYYDHIHCDNGETIYNDGRYDDDNVDCVVSSDQTINSGIYRMRSLTINNLLSLSVETLDWDVTNPSSGCGPACYGGQGGGGGNGNGAGALRLGGSGGRGGLFGHAGWYGGFGWSNNHPRPVGGRARGSIILFTQSMTINGYILAKGENGQSGFNEEVHGHNMGGHGGGGGGSGGSITIYTVSLDGSGYIFTEGGNGGDGGNGYGEGDDYGTGGGGGGAGGAGGPITIYHTGDLDNITEWFREGGDGLRSSAGSPGARASSGQAGGPYGGDGSNEASGSYSAIVDGVITVSQGVESTDEAGCNDGLDNDQDGSTDMADSDCYLAPSQGGQCPANTGPTSPPGYFPGLTSLLSSAFDGTDLCCGDDVFLANGDFELADDGDAWGFFVVDGNTETQYNQGLHSGQLWITDSAECHTFPDPGAAGRCVYWSIPPGAAQGSRQTRQDVANLPPGIYVAQAWLKKESGDGSIAFNIKTLRDDYYTITSSPTVSTESTLWKKVSVRFEVTDDTEWVRVTGGSDEVGQYYMDDVTIFPVSHSFDYAFINGPADYGFGDVPEWFCFRQNQGYGPWNWFSSTANSYKIYTIDIDVTQ